MRIGAVILCQDDKYLPRAARSVEDDVWRVYVVDNGSPEPVGRRLAALCEERGYALIATGRNLGYGKGNNLGIDRALGDGCEAVLVMNDDAFAHEDAVSELARHLEEHPGVGAAGPMVLWYPSGRVMHTGAVLDPATGRVEWVDHNMPVEEADRRVRPTGYLSGEAFLARAEVIRDCGAFDPRFHFYFEDAEWSLRVRRAGWELEVVPSAVFDHVWGGTIPSKAAAFHRAHSRPLFLRWALGKSWWSTARLSVRPTAYAAMLLVARGRPWSALRGALFGWVTGLVRLLGEGRSDPRASSGSGR
jgi:GT2 family glycosyltransferase